MKIAASRVEQMKIGVQTSHGDIRPFLALAEGLQLAGHDVTLLITCVDSDAYAGVTSPAGVASACWRRP
jgi:UDP:flavonoid glycosyltransferase YjiC (YdhE family)